MTERLKLARGLSIPREAMLQRWAILGMSGAGKSNTGVVMAEQMFAAGVPWVVVDPKGDWWGLRSSKTGKRGGLDVPIFGGDHGDIPLYADGGKVMADAVAKELSHSILDVSGFEKSEMLGFLIDFAERLYEINDTPIVLILEEADEYIPQNKESPLEAKSVAKWSRIVKRGRTRGILTILIALRNSELAKSVLNFSDTLVVHRATAKLDRDAVKGWVEYSGAARELLDSLAMLDDGEAWVSSPQKLKMTKRFHFYRRSTFDSGATPDLDTDRAQIALRSIDLSGIDKRMQATIERAKAEDPKELRKQIAELEKKLRERPEAEAPEPVEIKVPVLDAQVARDLNATTEDLEAILGKVPGITDSIKEAAGQARQQISAAELLVSRSSSQTPPRHQSPPTPAAAPPRQTHGSASPAHSPGLAAGGSDGGDLTGPQQRVLDAIAWWEEIGYPTPTKIQVGFIAGYRVGKKVGGTYGNILGQLRSAGLIDYPANGSVALTEKGHEQAAPAGIEKTTAGLQAAVMDRLDGPERRVLQVFIDRYPANVSKQEAGELAGYTVGEKIGGTYGNILGRLRSLGLIDYPGPGMAYALPVLFLEGR